MFSLRRSAIVVLNKQCGSSKILLTVLGAVKCIRCTKINDALCDLVPLVQY